MQRTEKQEETVGKKVQGINNLRQMPNPAIEQHHDLGCQLNDDAVAALSSVLAKRATVVTTMPA